MVIADRFRILRPIASGSAYAITYLADDLTRGEPIVIKEFFPRSLIARGTDGVSTRPHSPESGRDFLRALRRFVIESSVLSEIAHPHVVRARGLVEENGTAYLVLDQHHSQPLSEYLRVNGGRLTPPLAGRIVQHLLTALEPLHAESIVHRDLSPRSVHVQGDGSVLLLEFSARRHLPLHATDLASGFAAFEQYGMRDIGPWTDVYAASALLYYLLTGVVPPSALDRAAGEALQSPTTLVPNLSPGFARLVLRGMSLLPQQRPHVASELRRQLESLLNESTLPSNRAAPAAFPGDPMAPSLDGVGDYDPRSGTLKLAAGGIVLPGEERSDGLLRKLGSAASRFRRTPVATPQSPAAVRDEHFISESVRGEPQPAPTSERSPSVVEALPSAPLVAEPDVLTVAEPTRASNMTALMPVEEAALPSVEERLRPLDLAAQLALAHEEMEQHASAPDSRRRYSLMAAAALVIAIGGSLAFLARSSSASSGTASQSNANQSAAASAVTPPSPVPTHEVVESGSVLQTGARPDTAVAKPVVSPSRARAPEPAERHATPAPNSAPASPQVLPAGKLPNVNVAITGPAADLKIVPPEVLVDARTKLTNGQDAADQGDYAVARRAFRGALQQLDSLASRFPDSEKIRTLRRDVEKADAGALQACNAENEVRKRRGTEGKPCQ